MSETPKRSIKYSGPSSADETASMTKATLQAVMNELISHLAGTGITAFLSVGARPSEPDAADGIHVVSYVDGADGEVLYIMATTMHCWLEAIARDKPEDAKMHAARIVATLGEHVFGGDVPEAPPDA